MHNIRHKETLMFVSPNYAADSFQFSVPLQEHSADHIVGPVIRRSRELEILNETFPLYLAKKIYYDIVNDIVFANGSYIPVLIGKFISAIKRIEDVTHINLILAALLRYIEVAPKLQFKYIWNSLYKHLYPNDGTLCNEVFRELYDKATEALELIE